MKLRISILAISIVRCCVAMPAELAPFVKDNRLGVVVKQMRFPKNFSKDLVSGLSNKVLIRIELMEESRLNSQRVVDVTIKYDLWNENFKVSSTVASATPIVRTFSDLKSVLSYLDNLRLTNLWMSEELSKNASLSLKVDALLNPIEKEQMEKIRKWVIQNSISTPLDPTGLGSAKPVSPSRSNTLFNKIFEQYASGTNVASVWRDAITSKSFRYSEVKSEK